jgi:oligopeptide/dipeptide ABC transporter ATP-binding protein
MTEFQHESNKVGRILELNNLKKHFPLRAGLLKRVYDHVKAVDGISFYVKKGEVFGLVGESGCGKSTISKMILRLLEPTEGDISFQGKRLNDLSPNKMRKVRQNMQMIFQDPQASLNPRMKVHTIITRPMKVFNSVAAKNLTQEALRLLEKVGLKKDDLYRYPHQFSGGQQQRIGIARALGLRPKFLILDEPTSALDVSIQCQIIDLLQELRAELDLSYLFISHDLSLIKLVSQRTAVMYLGKIMELSDTSELFKYPAHPYTQTLISAIPRLDPLKKKKDRMRIQSSTSTVSGLLTGCLFMPRCRYADESCKTEPVLQKIAPGHYAACHKTKGRHTDV